MNVIGGGVDTATTATAWALRHLDGHPSDRARLIAQPDLWSTATEEFLRRYPPVVYLGRTVREDVVLNG
jgi:cytochrome P450